VQAVADPVGTLVEWFATLPDWQAALATMGGALCLAAVVHVGGDIVLKRLTARIPGEVDDVVLGNAHVGVWTSIGLVGVYLGTTHLDVSPGMLDVARATTLSAVTLIWAYTLVRTAPPVLEAVTASRYVDRQVVPIFQNIWTALAGGISLFLIFSFWEVNVTPLLASAGVLGIVVGLAARDAIANFFGSIALYADGTYTVGDYVVLESDERGRVEDISIRSTVIRTRDDVLVTIPNAQLNSAAIVNESVPQRHQRIRVPVGVAYGTDIEEVEDILLSLAEGSEAIRDRPTPRVFMREFGDSALNLELLCWIDDSRLRERARDDLMRAIYDAFCEADIEIPFPQRDVHVADEPDEAVPRPLDPTEEPVTGDYDRE
jgi:small-conductance mechanosensitive channel